MNQRTIFIILTTVLLLCWGCQSVTEDGGSQVLNPVIQSMSPNARALNLPWFTLTIEGENFREGAQVMFNDLRKTPEFVSANILRCTIHPGDLVAAAPAVLTTSSFPMDNLVASVPVYVVNVDSGGMDSSRSNTVEFSIFEHPRFQDPVNISQTAANAEFPMIASEEDGTLHVIWVDNSDGQGAVFYRRSDDRGDNWEDTQRITPVGIVACCPELAVDREGNVYVVFSGSGVTEDARGIFFLRSDDHGLTWDWYSMLSVPGQGAYIPDIAVNNYGVAAVVWFQYIREKRSDIFMTMSTDYGITWSTPVNLSDNIGHSDSPSVAVDAEGNIFAAWKDNRPGDWDIFFRGILNYGAQWNPIINLSNDVLGSVRPVMTCDSSGGVYVSWFDLGALDREIYITRSWDNGYNWTAVDTVSNDSALSSEPAIAIDSIGNANVIWTNYGFGTNRQEIVYSRGIYGSGPWSPGVAVTPGTSAILPNYPDIAVDSNGNIYLVWQQWLNFTHNQIMFTHSR